MSPEDLTPTFVPKNFSRRRTSMGAAVQVVSGDADKVLVSHYDADLPESPVSVAGSTDSGAQLTGTETRKGTPVDLDAPNVTAVYHDGMWAPGPGPSQIDDGEVIIHWDTGYFHSITARTPGGQVFVQAPRSVDLEALLEITRSVPLVGRA